MQPHDGLLASTTPPHVAGGGNWVDAMEFLAGLDPEAATGLQDLFSIARQKHYGQHEAMYYEGGDNSTVYLVTSGFLKLIIHLPNGRARIVRLHRTGAVLGLSGLFDRHTKHTAVAVIPVTALCLPLSAVQRLRLEDPAAYACLLELRHSYLSNADIWIAQFSTGPIRGRVARLLAFLSEFEPDAVHGTLHLLTCEEMGAILGVTSESVSRVLAEFKRQDILALSDGTTSKAYAADLARLNGIAEA